jgi:hypothetical protein
MLAVLQRSTRLGILPLRKGSAMRTSKKFMLGTIISLLLVFLGMILSRAAEAQMTTGTSGGPSLGGGADRDSGASAIWDDGQGHSGSGTTEVPAGGTNGQTMTCEGNNCTVTAPAPDKKAKGPASQSGGLHSSPGPTVSIHPPTPEVHTK